MTTFGKTLGVLVTLLAMLFALSSEAIGSGERQRGEPQGLRPIIGTPGPVELNHSDPATVRSRAVQISHDILYQAAMLVDEQPRMTLELFDDVTLTIDIQRAKVHGERHFTMFGRVARTMGGHASFTVYDSNVAGYISIPGVGEYTIRPEGMTGHRIRQVDPQQRRTCGVKPQDKAPNLNRMQRDELPPTEVSMDIEPLVVHVLGTASVSSVNSAGGMAAMMALFENDIQFTNTVLENSEVNVVMDLLFVTTVDYDESEVDPLTADALSDALIDLANENVHIYPQSPTGPETVQQWRNLLCADLVVMVVDFPPTAEGVPLPCGVAFLMNSLSVEQYGTGYSVIRLDCMPGGTVAHEFGHNFGCQHDHFASGMSGGIFSYSHGHRYWAPLGPGGSNLLVGTIMTYPPIDAGLAIFSNPEISFPAGFPTGVPIGRPNEADNALSVINTTPIVSSYGDFLCDDNTVRNVPTIQYPTIQSAINASEDGDHIIVGNGTYNESINLQGKAIYLRSQNGPGVTFIDGTGLSGMSVVRTTSGEGRNTIIQGFTIRNGENALRGGGVQIINSSPTIVQCSIVDNTALLSGGGVHIENGSPLFLNTWINDNSTPNNGGGIYAVGGTPRISGGRLQGNFSGKKGGAIFAKDSDLIAKNVIIGYTDPSAPPVPAQRNEAAEGGGALFVLVDEEEDEEDWILPRIGSSQICGNLPNNFQGPWENLTENTICTADSNITVCPPNHPNAPCDYTLIQHAVNSAADGDVIILQPNQTYQERIEFKGKAITIRSTDPSDDTVVASTIIDGQGQGSVVKFIDEEESDSILRGVTITGGNASSGGGVHADNSSPTIENCVFLNNHAASSGGGAAFLNSAARVIGCRFINNTATNSGGGIYSQNSSNLWVQDCTFQGNHAAGSGGGMANFTGGPTIFQSIFNGNTTSNRGGAIYNASNSNPVVVFSEIRANTATTDGGGIYSTSTSQTSVAVTFFCENAPVDIGGPWEDMGDVEFPTICPPLNNMPHNPAQFAGPTGSVNGSFLGATNDGQSTCEPDGVDVFYSYTVTDAPVSIQVDTCGSGGDTALTMFDPNGVEVGCNLDCAGSPCGSPHACLHIDATVNGTYLIRVSEVSSALAAQQQIEYVLNIDYAQETIPGDLNGDGVVDSLDLLILFENWGECPSSGDCPADLNSDGDVDALDLLILLQNWG